MKRVLFRFLPLVLILCLGFIFWRGLALNPQHLPSPLINKPLPRFSLPLLNQGSEYLTENSFKGHISLLNIFASWCATCEEEQDFLQKLASQGFPIYGINYKDSPRNAYQWLQTYGNPYKKIAVDNQGLVAIDLGVYGTPETFLIDKSGKVQLRYAGSLDEHVWNTTFLPRIKALEKSQ